MSGVIGWDLDGGAGGGSEDKVNFTRFSEGTTFIRILDDAPHIRWTHWMNQFKRSVNCPGMKVCPIDDIINKQRANKEKPTYNSSKRYSMNIYNYDQKQLEIMEQGRTFMEDLAMIRQDLKEEGKSLSDVVLRVRRTGMGKDDTKYRIDISKDADEPMPEGALDLMEFFKPHTPEQITQLLSVTASTSDEFTKAWNDIMSPPNEQEEEIEVR